MSRAIKERIVKQYATRFSGVADVAVVSTQGINVLRMTALRRALRSKGVRALVVQNRLCKVALKGAGLEAATDLLKGPTTLVWGGDTIVDLAKVLTAEARSVKELQIRGGVSGGKRLSKEDIETLSKMPGRLELLAMVAGTFLGPRGEWRPRSWPPQAWRPRSARSKRRRRRSRPRRPKAKRRRPKVRPRPPRRRRRKDFGFRNSDFGLGIAGRLAFDSNPKSEIPNPKSVSLASGSGLASLSTRALSDET